jgi:hypothetical protein
VINNSTPTGDSRIPGMAAWRLFATIKSKIHQSHPGTGALLKSGGNTLTLDPDRFSVLL